MIQKYHYKVTQKVIHPVDEAVLIGSKNRTDHQIFHVYQSVNTFNSRKHDVPAVIGMMALGDANQRGVAMSAIAQSVPELVNAAIVHLAMKPELWRFVGPTEATAQLQGSISDEADHVRCNAVKDLLGIFERRSSAFLFLDRHGSLTAGDEIGDRHTTGKRGFTMVFDAVGYADELSKRCPGPLFTLEAEEAK